MGLPDSPGPVEHVQGRPVQDSSPPGDPQADHGDHGDRGGAVGERPDLGVTRPTSVEDDAPFLRCVRGQDLLAAAEARAATGIGERRSRPVRRRTPRSAGRAPGVRAHLPLSRRAGGAGLRPRRETSRAGVTTAPSALWTRRPRNRSANPSAGIRDCSTASPSVRTARRSPPRTPRASSVAVTSRPVRRSPRLGSASRPSSGEATRWPGFAAGSGSSASLPRRPRRTETANALGRPAQRGVETAGHGDSDSPAVILANRTPAIAAISQDFLSPRGGACAL